MSPKRRGREKGTFYLFVSFLGRGRSVNSSGGLFAVHDDKVTTDGYGNLNQGTQQTSKQIHESGVHKTTTTNTYDLQGRLESVTVKTFDAAGVTTRIEETTYTYNSSGIRVPALREVDDNGDGTNESVRRTEYLNDPHNHTGYSQVLQETVLDPATGHTRKRIVYTLGHNKIAQTTITYTSGAPVSRKTLVFDRDGHGSTRVLTEMAGAIATVEGVQQLFNYDAHGNLLNRTAA